MPEYAPLADVQYPLTLISPANHRTINSIFGEFQAPEPVVWLHPDDAAARGIVDGAAVEVVNDRGRVRLVARISDDLRRGVCASPKGRWLTPDGDGLNTLVTGENGSGKSTFIDALTTLLVPAMNLVVHRVLDQACQRSIRRPYRHYSNFLMT